MVIIFVPFARSCCWLGPTRTTGGAEGEEKKAQSIYWTSRTIHPLWLGETRASISGWQMITNYSLGDRSIKHLRLFSDDMCWAFVADPGCRGVSKVQRQHQIAPHTHTQSVRQRLFGGLLIRTRGFQCRLHTLKNEPCLSKDPFLSNLFYLRTYSPLSVSVFVLCSNVLLLVVALIASTFVCLFSGC